jgi:hypothetical protein
MVTRILVRLLVASALLALTCVSVSAGGPVCRPPACGPVCAPPPMCGPMPICGPAPCPPLAACLPPKPVCGPPCPPPECKENPLAKIFKGTTMLVSGVISLPFKLVDCLIEGISGPSKCQPPRMACAPAPCAPPPPMCGPAPCAPGMGYGMGMPRPMGMGYGRPKSKPFVPFAAEKSVPDKLLAGPPEGFFGAFW